MKKNLNLRLLLLCFAWTFSSAMAEPTRPNIVLIICDDLGYSDVGFNGAKDIKTPSLDRLALQGTVLTSGYVPHPFCGPSRMGLMTGRYPHEFGAPFNLPGRHHGLEEYNKLGVDVNEKLISSVLKDAGYFTGAVGKWHMGTEREYHPNTRGFDEFYGFLGGGHKYFPEEYEAAYDRQVKAGNKLIYDYVLPLERNGKNVRETEYLTDGLSREAVRFVENAASREQPFFLYLAYNAPHVPLEAKREDIQLYGGIKDEKRRVYAAMVSAVDRGIGKIVDSLQATSEIDNTLIVFLSDNGGKLSEGATNHPLREGKGSTYEGGYRVPMLFNWPGEVPSGKRYDHPVSALDFYPTFARLANAPLPESKEIDGVDIWDSLLAGQSPREGKMIYAIRHRSGFSDVGARLDRWKLSRVGNGPWRLFNVADDLGEDHDLGQSRPDLLREMVEDVEKWSRTHTQPRWFHAADARDQWSELGMPNYSSTFQVDDVAAVRE